jgi:hypothetical protein
MLNVYGAPAGWLAGCPLARKTHQEILDRKQWHILKEMEEVKCEFVVSSGQMTNNLSVNRTLATSGGEVHFHPARRPSSVPLPDQCVCNFRQKNASGIFRTLIPSIYFTAPEILTLQSP